MLFRTVLSGLSILAIAAPVSCIPIDPDGALDPQTQVAHLFDAPTPPLLYYRDLENAIEARNPPAPKKPITIYTLKQCMDAINVPKDTAVFFSGPPTVEAYMQVALNYIKKRQPKGQILELSWKPGQDLMKEMRSQWPESELPPRKPANKELKQFFDNASSALAHSASGVVHVVLPGKTKGTDFWTGGSSIWVEIEWPILIKNPRVQKIIRVNADKNWEEEVIFQRSKL